MYGRHVRIRADNDIDDDALSIQSSKTVGNMLGNTPILCTMRKLYV